MLPHTSPKIVLCMKWGSLFPATYVNVLFSAVCANLTPPFRFICLTDDDRGLNPGIEALPIPDIGLSPEEWYSSGVWPKLALYAKDLHGLTGRALFIDLDMMVVGSLDAFFDLDGPMIFTNMGSDWRADRPMVTGTCLFAFDIGRQAQILERFLADKEGVKLSFQNEQDFAGANATSVSFWPSGLVISFKRHLARRYGLDLFRDPLPPPPTARVLAFHGVPRPADLLKRGIWGQLPHIGRGPVSWVADYWARHGGTKQT